MEMKKVFEREGRNARNLLAYQISSSIDLHQSKCENVDSISVTIGIAHQLIRSIGVSNVTKSDSFVLCSFTPTWICFKTMLLSIL